MMFTKFTYILNINNVEIVLHVSYIIVVYFYKLKSDTKKSLKTIFIPLDMSILVMNPCLSQGEWFSPQAYSQHKLNSVVGSGA